MLSGCNATCCNQVGLHMKRVQSLVSNAQAWTAMHEEERIGIIQGLEDEVRVRAFLSSSLTQIGVIQDLEEEEVRRAHVCCS